METLLTILLFIVLLSVIIIVHECGHLIAAKAFGVYCQEFSIGMGPKLFSKKGKETEFSIRAVPFGGFVAMAGDTDNDLETKVDTNDIPYERTLPGISRIKRIIIMLAGIIMNAVLALVIVAMVILASGTYAKSPAAVVGDVMSGSPAEIAGLMAGDKIIEARYDELNISIEPTSFEDFMTFTYGHDEDVLTIVYMRDGKVAETELTKVYMEDVGQMQYGIYAGESEVIDVNILNCWGCAIDYLAYATRSIFMALGQLFVGQGLENLSGPVGVFEVTSQAVSQGFSSYLLLIGLLSLDVGIFNALPLPILDGGRVLILLIEAIIRRPLNEKVINGLMYASMIIILGLFVFVTYQDITRLF